MARHRAPTVCPQPGCPNDHPCAEHAPKPWAGSDRRSRLPRNWATLRRRVLARDRGLCRRCGQPGNEVDHVIHGDDHTLANLQTLCSSCHQAKTLAEARQGRRASGAPTH